MPITGQGWEFHVQRLGLHQSGDQVRTYGSYRVLIEGNPASASEPLLEGFVCETAGPGANNPANNGRRIEAGRYPITTQFGKYVTIGFSTDTHVAAKPHMPAVALDDTGARSGILIHPGHPAAAGDPPFSFLSSVGCFNLTQALAPDDDMNYFESRARVIALINSLAAFGPSAFRDANGHPIMHNTAVAGAFAIIDGEPMNVLNSGMIMATNDGDPDLESNGDITTGSNTP